MLFDVAASADGGQRGARQAVARDLPARPPPGDRSAARARDRARADHAGARGRGRAVAAGLAVRRALRRADRPTSRPICRRWRLASAQALRRVGIARRAPPGARARRAQRPAARAASPRSPPSSTAAAGLAIITEGLLGYLPRPTCARSGGGSPPRCRASRAAATSPTCTSARAQTLEVRGFRVLLSAFVRGRVYLHFGDPQRPRPHCVQAGFATVTIAPGDRLSPVTRRLAERSWRIYLRHQPCRLHAGASMIEATLYSDPACPWAYSESPALRVIEWRYRDQLRVGADRDRPHRGRLAVRRARLHAAARGARPAALQAPLRDAVLAGAQAARQRHRPRLPGDRRGQAPEPRHRVATCSARSSWRTSPRRWCSRTTSSCATVLDGRARRRRRRGDRRARLARGQRGLHAQPRVDPFGAGLGRRAAGQDPTSDGPVRFTAPSIVFSSNGTSLVAGGFQPVEAYDVLIANLDPTLHREPPPETPEPLLEYFEQRADDRRRSRR